MRAMRTVTTADRIKRAYEITEAQKDGVERILNAFCAARRRRMGEDYGRSLDVQIQWLDLKDELFAEWKRRREAPGADPSVGPPKELYQEYNDALELSRQWIDNHPHDWNDFVRQIEEVLPKDQVGKGRKRLAEQYPHGFSSHAHVEIWPDRPKDDAVEEAPDRWEAYYKEFVGRHELSGGQADAAKSILHEVAKRAARIEHTMANQIARVCGSDEPKTVALVEEAFGFDTDDLFEEFQSRLDALLTTAQRHRPATPAISDTKDDKQILPSLSASGISER